MSSDRALGVWLVIIAAALALFTHACAHMKCPHDAQCHAQGDLHGRCNLDGSCREGPCVEWSRDGVVVDRTCEIPCRPDDSCPTGLSCWRFVDVTVKPICRPKVATGAEEIETYLRDAGIEPE